MAELRAEVAVLGAGPAGLTTALALARRGRDVVVVERSRSRRRRLCGEFLSGDGWQVLEGLGLTHGLRDAGCPVVDVAVLSVPGGPVWTVDVAGLGRGCSRGLLSDTLAAAAEAAGVRILRGTRVDPPEAVGPARLALASDGSCQARSLRVELAVWAGGQAGAAGVEARAAKPSHAGRPERRRWLGVALHGRIPGRRDHARGRVELHAVPGGYVGLGPVEGGRVNLCGLLPAPGSGADAVAVLCAASRANEHLEKQIRDLDVDPESLATVAGVDFGGHPGSVPLSVGDAAAAPAPVLGQGLAAGLAGGVLLADWVERHLAGELGAEALAAGYRRAWRRQFGARLRWGRWLHAGLLQPRLAAGALGLLRVLPAAGRWLVRRTRGRLPEMP